MLHGGLTIQTRECDSIGTFCCASETAILLQILAAFEHAASLSRYMEFLTKLIFVFLTVCALSDSTHAQTGERSNPTIFETGRIAQAVRVEHPPKVDGTLNGPLWNKAVPIRDFRQQEPYEGQPATESPEVSILYTHNELYFGITCHDSMPHGIVATQLRRDVTQEFDDYFEIVIDSRHDRRNAYVFQINP